MNLWFNPFSAETVHSVKILSNTVGEQRLIASNSIESDQDLATYVISHGYRLMGAVDIMLLRHCLDRIVTEVPILRAVFDEHPIVATRMHVVNVGSYFSTHADIADSDEVIAEFCEACATQSVSYRDGPLFRADIARCGDDGCVLVLSWDHTICDAWSVSLCLRWLSELYNNADHVLPAGAAKWPAFVQQEIDAIKRTTEPGSFWASQIVSARPAELHGRRVDELSGQAVSFVVALGGPDFTCRCASVGATRSVVILAAAFAASGAFTPGLSQSALVLPTVLSNRDDEFTDTVGLLMRTALIRLSLENCASPTVADVRTQMMQQLGAMFAHRHESVAYVFERYRANVDRFSELPLPLFVQLVDVPARELVLKGCAIDSVYRGFERSSRFAAEVHIRPDRAGGVEALFIFDPFVYTSDDVRMAADTMKRWVNVFSDASMSESNVFNVEGSHGWAVNHDRNTIGSGVGDDRTADR